MAYSVIQNIDYGTATAGTSITTGSYTFTAGNRIVIWAMTFASSDITTGCTDTNGNIWSKVPSGAFTYGGATWVAWECKNVTVGGSTQITVTLSASSGNRAIAGWEISGLSPTASVQTTITNLQNGPGTATDAITTGNMTPTGASAVVLNMVQAGSTLVGITAGTGFTGYTCTSASVFNGGSTTLLEHKRITSTSAVAATATTSSSGAFQYFSFGLIISEVGYQYVGTGINSSNSNVISYTMASRSNLAVICSFTTVGTGSPYPTSVVTNNGRALAPVYGTYGTSSSYISIGGGLYFVSVFYYVPNTDSSAPTSFTFTYNGGTPGGCVLVLAEYSGVSTLSPLIGTPANPNVQSAPGTGADAITSLSQIIGTVPALVLGLSLDLGGPSFVAGTGYTLRTNNAAGGGSYGYCFEDLRATVSATQQAKFTTITHGSDSFVSFLLGFAEPSTSTFRAQFMLMGVG